MRGLSARMFIILLIAALSCTGDDDSSGFIDAHPAMTSCAKGSGKYDPDSGLCWQDPPSDLNMNWETAIAYCKGLELGGLKDWRLPKIQELISLVRGCDQSECGLNDPKCLGDNCFEYCNHCVEGRGPGKGGCFWDASMSGACCLTAAWVNGKCSYTQGWWSSSTYTTNTSDAWLVDFNTGDVPAFRKNGSNNVYIRCVRDGR